MEEPENPRYDANNDGDASDVEQVKPTEPEDKPAGNEPMIVHRQQYVDSAGNVGVKEHGPMPVKDWAQYEKDNNL